MNPTDRPLAREPFHLLAKPSGSACNLGCGYCFYLEKAHLYPGSAPHRMSRDTLEAYVRDYIGAQPGPSVSFGWQGGEPTLLGIGFFREAVELQRRYAGGKSIENGFQTNGVLIDDDWAEFLAREKFLVGISIDGPREMHDAHRTDKGGRPTFDRVMSGLSALKRHGVDFNTLTSVHSANSRHPKEVYRFLREIGSRFLQFIPIVERAAAPGAAAPGLRLAPPPDDPEARGLEDRATPWSVAPEDYGRFLCAVFDEWVGRDVGRVFVGAFESALANWMGLPPGTCVFHRDCGRALVLEHNGDVYSCDHYVYPAYRLGNLHETPLAELADSPAQIRFGQAKSATLPLSCRKCPVGFACRGECPKHRFLRAIDGEPGLNYLCAGYWRFFRHIDSAMLTMAELLRRELSPALIMKLPRARWVRSQFSNGHN
jgi:uncharacterized protein